MTPSTEGNVLEKAQTAAAEGDGQVMPRLFSEETGDKDKEGSQDVTGSSSVSASRPFNRKDSSAADVVFDK